MQHVIVDVPSIREPIQSCPGFAKKELADYKLDLMGLCQFGCRYCSSNWGNYARINRSRFAALTEHQAGRRLLPDKNPELTLAWPDVLPKLQRQLERRRGPNWGLGKTLVFSMLTDGFSPMNVRSGLTEAALRLVLEMTAFRVRVLTKNAIVGTSRWINFFEQNQARFVVGLSTGTLDDRWAKQVELFTPPPGRRLQAIRELQDAGIPTYGMLCPVFPDMLNGDRLEELVDQIRPDRVEQIWVEPFNDRNNWEHVRAGFEIGSPGYARMTDIFSRRKSDAWSTYATELYVRLREKARREGWLDKLRYLLYEDWITDTDAWEFRGLEGVLLQSKPAVDGKSRNPEFARMQ